MHYLRNAEDYQHIRIFNALLNVLTLLSSKHLISKHVKLM